MLEKFKHMTKLTKMLFSIVFVLMIASIFIGIGEKVQEDKVFKASEHENRETEVEKIDPDVLSKSKESEENIPEKKSKADHTDLSDDNLAVVDEHYLALADEQSPLVIKIEPKSDDYEEINIMIDESIFNTMDDGLKQNFVDSFGGKVENYTRAMIYKTPSSDFLYVYFVNNKQEQLVKTGHFDKGWKIK